MSDEAALSALTATAILGTDTLFGGDVLDPSGTGRVIADSWFADAPQPEAYTHPAAARLRAAGGLSAAAPDLAAIDAYLAAVDVPGAIEALAARARALPGLRGATLRGAVDSLRVIWDLGQELLGRGAPVPFERCVEAATGRPPRPSAPAARREALAGLLGRAGHPSGTPDELLAAVDAWRRERLAPMKSVGILSAALVAELDAQVRRHLAPHLPADLAGVPLANVRLVPLAEAYFSGSMNYLGRARRADGSPEYEADYELNTSLEISVPELVGLVAHEVVPGHVTTFALAQALYVRGRLGFEQTVQTMNSRAATLAEGIANNALMMAHGVVEVADLPDPDLQIGMLLFHLQDEAKNQAAWLTWGEGRPQPEVEAALRRDFAVSAERAAKLSGPWARHPLHGRMSLPAYLAGTDKVAELRRALPPERVLPALFGCAGPVDVVTIEEAVGGPTSR